MPAVDLILAAAVGGAVALAGPHAAIWGRRLWWLVDPCSRDASARADRVVAALRRSQVEREVSRTITLDDFEPTEAQADQIRSAVADFERQRTPTTMKPCQVSPGGQTYDFDGPRADAGRLLGVVFRGEIAMFYQWRGDRFEHRDPARAALQAFWRSHLEAVDSDGWPLKPEKVFEINPGEYGAMTREYVPHWDPDRMHPILQRELGIS